MNRIDELREQIDACRSGSDDLHLPELAGLARWVGEEGKGNDAPVAGELDRSQRFDRNVVSALHDVSVPAGLLERLLEKTAAAGSDSAAAATLGTAVTAAVDPPANMPSSEAATIAEASRGISRRGWLLSVGAAGLIAASTIAVAFVFWPVSPQGISLEQLTADVPQWNEMVKAPEGWQSSPSADLLRAYPVDSLRTRAVKWRHFRTARGERGVVYDVTPVGGVPVRLFVIATPHHYVVAPAPRTLLLGMTGGVNVGAWQRSTGLLYVLVVERGGHPLDAYLRDAPEA